MMLPLRTNLKYLFLLIFFTAIYTITWAQINVRAERPNTRYELGETANFRVTGAANGTVSYQIKYTLVDTLPLLASGTVQVVNGVANIAYTATEPVYLTCKIVQNRDSVYAGASFSVEKLQPLEAAPCRHGADARRGRR